jgi:hypothetical protein
MLILRGKDVLGPVKILSTQCPVHLTFDLLTPISKKNIFLPWVVYMCGMVALGEKGNILEPRNCISTSMSRLCLVFDLFDSKNNREYPPPMGTQYM